MKIRMRRREAPASSKIGLIALICCSCAILHTARNPLVSGQQTSATSPLPATTITIENQQQLLNNLQRQKQAASKPTQRIGLAPHDRPACQLTTHHHQAQLQSPRQLSITADQQQLNNNNNLTSNNSVSSYAPTISSPNVVSLAAGSPLSSDNTTAQAPGEPAAAPHQRKATDTSERLRQLRQLLLSNSYDAYLVGPKDEHGSEYVSDYDRRLQFISGFSGSNGYALILLDRAVLFTDGRYALQADQELDCNWWLVVGDAPETDVALWLRLNAPRGLKVATDARLMSLQLFDQLDEELRTKLDSEFVLISQDLVDVVWTNLQQQQHSGDSRDQLRPRPMGPIQVQPIEFAGQISWQEKLVRLAEQMFKLRARHYVIAQLDDIAWLLNLRGSDIPMSPLFKAYLLVSRTTQPAGGQTDLLSSLSSPLVTGRPTTARAAPGGLSLIDKLFQQQQANTLVQAQELIRVTLYVDLNKVTPQIREHLHVDNGTVVVSPTTTSGEQETTLTSRIQVELKDYDVFIMDFRDKFSSPISSHQTALAGKPMQDKLLLDVNANVAIHVLAKNYDDRLLLVEPLIQRMKSVKNDLEVKGMRTAHWRDSLAISMLLAQLDRDVGQLKLTRKWNEISAAKDLEFYRSLMDFNQGQSFETISAYGSNGAVVHYKPNADVPASEYRAIGNDSTYLLDSGGQYLDGTTDITRTVHFGEPTQFQRETYTRVLMGAIDMMSLIFAQSNRVGYKLDDLVARRHLLEIGLDYMHGTGHGIGSYSMVHEAPWLIQHYITGNAQNKPAKSAKQQQLIHSEPIQLQPNMFTSVEPGYYKANDFGIRLENIVVTQRVPARAQDEAAAAAAGATPPLQRLRFEPISLVPFEPKLIKFELLSNKQKAWLNSYNLMVRLRMTQQINYYLTKIKQSRQQAEQQQVTAARLYRQLSSANASSSPAQQQQQQQPQLFPSGRDNFLRLDADRFQRLLEQAHKWIMSKTELIPLDVPQRSLVGARSPQSNSKFTKQSADQQQDDWTALGGDLNGQRLMLGYMSSFPFNDHEAAQAAAALAGRAGADSPAGSSDQAQPQANKSTNEQPPLNMSGNDRSSVNANSSSSAAAANKQTNKCSGIECDLWLLEVLNSQVDQQLSEQSGNRARRRNSAARQQSSTYGWPAGTSPSAFGAPNNDDTDNELNEPSTPTDATGGSGSNSGQFLAQLFDMFSLGDPADQTDQQSKLARLLGAWPLLAFGLLVALQLAIMAYVCQSRSARAAPPTGRRNTSASSRSRSSGANSTLTAVGAVPDRPPPQQQRASGRQSSGRRSEPDIAAVKMSPVLGQQQMQLSDYADGHDHSADHEHFQMATSQFPQIQIGSPAFVANELMPSMQHKASI